MARKAIYDENAIDRIPVCLKFEKDDEFYTEFVVPLRQNRELSSFIIKLLRTYYEKEAVSKAIDDVLEEESPFAAIRESIEKLADINIVNNMAISSMKGALNMGKSVLNETQKPTEEKRPSSVVEGFEDTVGFEVEPEIEKVLLENRPIEEIVKNSQQILEQQSEDNASSIGNSSNISEEIEQRFQKIEGKLSTVDAINSKLDMLLAGMGATVASQEVTVEPTVEPTAESRVEVETSQEVIVEPADTINEENKVNVIVGTETEDEEEIDLDAEVEEVPTIKSMDDIMAEALAMSQKKVDNEKKEEADTIKIEPPKPKVPKAFSKLAGSI